MDQNPFVRVVRPDEPGGFEALSAAVRDWEPRLELYRPPRNALLYEPDGTLYAICLGRTMTFRADRRVVEVSRGDAVVVPQAVAVDAGPEVDLLALRYDGPPPDHFRERFIQVWGFEHIPAPRPDPSRVGLAEVIPGDDARHRIPYAVVDAGPANAHVNFTIRDVGLVVGLAGTAELRLDRAGASTRVDLPEGGLVGVLPGTTFRVEGPARIGVVTVLNELAYEARRFAPGERPEFRPRA